MLEQREAGMLLVMNSKNNEQDVLDTFAAIPRCRCSYGTSWVGGSTGSQRLRTWRRSPRNYLGLDSFIFVDDSPKECAEVAGMRTGGARAYLAEDIARTPQFLEHVWAFDHPVVTEEDRHRSAYYTQAQEFGREVKRASNLEEFVAGLAIGGLASRHLARRASQPRSAVDPAHESIQLHHHPAVGTRDSGLCFASKVTSASPWRYPTGSAAYGLVGVLIFRAAGTAFEVDTFLLSCRVLGRGVEHRMMSWLGEEALTAGSTTVVVRLEITKKNKPAQQFLQSIGETSKPMTRSIGSMLHAHCAQLRWTPATSVEAPKQQPKPVSQAHAAWWITPHRERTARRPPEILEAMRRESAGCEWPRGDDDRRRAPARGDLERSAEAFRHSRLRLTSSTSGGHSLLAVVLIVRVREAFGVELPIDDVYSATLTLGELARKIEAYQLSHVNPEEYEALLAEIEGLSDEEVQALLSKEDSS